LFEGIFTVPESFAKRSLIFTKLCEAKLNLHRIL
jgi:hypothetical protein